MEYSKHIIEEIPKNLKNGDINTQHTIIMWCKVHEGGGTRLPTLLS
jgi:hypothetical protein